MRLPYTPRAVRRRRRALLVMIAAAAVTVGMTWPGPSGECVPSFGARILQATQ